MNAMNPALLGAPAPPRPAPDARASRSGESSTGDADFAERLQQARQREAARPPGGSTSTPRHAERPNEAGRRSDAAEAERPHADDERDRDADDEAPLPGSEAWLLALGLPPGAAAVAAHGRGEARGVAGDASAPGLAIARSTGEGRPGDLAGTALDDSAGARDAKRPAADPGDAGPARASAARPDPDALAQDARTEAASPAGPGIASEDTRSAASALPARTEGAFPAAGLGHTTPLPGHASSANAPAAAPFEAHLAAALDSPQFAPALGHQLGLLVRDGVQEARLHLNPADMGPVSVQISLDGALARVEFRAEAAATRAALEASLPDLAAALRESGLMLAGGGVFDRRGDEARPGAQGGAARVDAAPVVDATAGSAGVAPAAPLRAARGVVDLYA